MRTDKAMKHRILAKLRSRAGDSIAELLIALLISSLAMVMLAGAVSSASNMIRRGNTAMTAYFTEDNALAERTTDDGNPPPAATVTLKEGSNDVQNWAVKYYSNDTFGRTHVVAYAKPAA